MAGKSTISITFKLDGDAKGFKDLIKDAEGLKASVTNTVSQAQKLNTSTLNFAAMASAVDAAQRSLNQLEATTKDLADAYAVQEIAERKLETVMRQRMGVTDEEIQGIKDLASAQQALGVIGDEVQLSGAQQLATFLTQRQSLEVLIPAMNNLIAQQKGLSATTQDAVNVGNLMGKVMQGQIAALTRVGITFDEAEKNVLKYGTESEKAAMLAQVITNNVGQMNAQLAQTDSGKQQQLVNTLGDYKEIVGSLVTGVQPYVTIAAQASTAAANVSTLVMGVKALTVATLKNAKAVLISTAGLAKTKVGIMAVTAATAAWASIQKVLNVVLSSNPIGAIVMAIAGLVIIAVQAYRENEKFRKICDALWGSIKNLAGAIINGLCKAFKWVAEKCAIAWGWLKKILGFDGEEAEVKVKVSTETDEKKVDPAVDEMKKKYANYKPTTTKDLKPGKVDTTIDTKKSEGLIGVLEDKISDARQRLRDATSEAAIESINKEIDAYQSQLSKYEDLGKDIGDSVQEGMESTGPIWTEDANTLKEITDNVQILSDKLQDASIEEAAGINKQIEAWNQKADAIRNAGKEAESFSVSTRESLETTWGAMKGLGSGIDSISYAITGNGNAWQKTVSIVDGFIQAYKGVAAIVGIIGLLTAASETHATVKGVEAVTETTAAAARTTAAASTATTSAVVITANKLEAASWKELASAEYMAAHAYIPFAGFGIAAGFTTAMLAMTAAAGIPMLAEGGVITGPTLAMVGEYAGASNNPEIVAPLDKLKNLVQPRESLSGGKVVFEIEGRKLVGILQRENNLTRRR